MPVSLPTNFSHGGFGNKLYIGIAVILVVFLSGAVVIVYTKAQQARNLLQQAQNQSFNAPQEAVKEQVQRITLTKNNGERVEILLNGQIHQYDANGNLIKSGLLGYYQVNRLFGRIEAGLNGFAADYLGLGDYILTIYTNKGTVTINVSGGGSGGDIDDIIDDIEDIEDSTLNPTPSPTPQPTLPGVATPTPVASGAPQPTHTPTPTPTVGPGTPTPLPPYMTEDPFTCEDYAAQLLKPFPISNILCGFTPPQ